MKNFKRLLIFSLMGLFLFTGLACNKGGVQKREIKKIPFLLHEHWNKPKAEYQLYNMTVGWYGAPRKSKDSQMILVKEPWDLKKNVKTGGKPSAAVLKFSSYDQFKTGTYNYSFKSDFFFDVANGRVIKWIMTSQDGCGISVARYAKVGGTGYFTWDSYWNDHGVIGKRVSTKDFDTFFNALPVYLRFRLKEKEYTIKVIQNLVGNHPPGTKKLDSGKILSDKNYPKIVTAKVTNSDGGKMKVNGKDVPVTKTEVIHGKKTDVLYFTKDMPHTLVKAEGKFSKELYYSNFFPYWKPKYRGKLAGNLPKLVSEKVMPEPKEMAKKIAEDKKPMEEKAKDSKVK